VTWRRAGDLARANVWALKSWLFGGLGSAVDYALVWTLAGIGSVPTFGATLAGLVVGGGINFTANRLFVFPDAKEATTATQAVRFALLMVALTFAHALSVAFARDTVGVPLLVAKMGADLFYFGPGYPFLLRWLIFRR
jgi:putative flippase GtrA